MELRADGLNGFLHIERFAVHAFRKDEFALIVIVGFNGRVLALYVEFRAAGGQLLLERRQLQRIGKLVLARLLVAQNALQRVV